MLFGRHSPGGSEEELGEEKTEVGAQVPGMEGRAEEGDERKDTGCGGRMSEHHCDVTVWEKSCMKIE